MRASISAIAMLVSCAAHEPAERTANVATAACIADPVDDAIARWPETRGDAVLLPLHVEAMDDADGDGVPEQLVVAEAECGTSGNCPRSIYLSRNGCTTYAGTTWWAFVETLPAAHDGVHDLEAYLKGGCAGLEGTIVRLRWRKDRYVVAREIECACIEARPEPGRDPACPTID